MITWPCQLPARDLMVSNDFCASGFGAFDFSGSDWVRATVESDNGINNNIRRCNFILVLLKKIIGFLERGGGLFSRDMRTCLVLYLTTTLSNLSSFLLSSDGARHLT